jgi:ankyrin repeat protein
VVVSQRARGRTLSAERAEPTSVSRTTDRHDVFPPDAADRGPTKEVVVSDSTIDLEQARKRAKELFRAARAGDLEALGRLGDSPRLADAQRAVASDLGHSSWAELKHHVEAERASFDVRVRRFVEDATVGRLDRARRWLKHDPGIAAAGVVPALLLGDAARVRKELRRDPALPRVQLRPRNWTPLLYVSHSAFLGRDRQRTPGLVETARILLAAGADPNATAASPNWPGSIWTPLYGAAGVAHEPELTRLLLAAGADPDDGESVYHACESRDHTCLRLLLEHGATVDGTNALAHMLDYDDLEGLRLLLDAGADPNGGPLHHAILRGRDARFVELLVERGADVESPNRQGLTPYALAVRLDRGEVAELLTNHGAAPTAGPVDDFLAACRQGDAGAVHAAIVENPELVPSLRARDLELLPESASWKDDTTLRVLLDVGFPIDAPGELDGTALHQAAWWGRAGNVALLLERGADVHRGSWFGPDSTPLAWATHGSTQCPNRDGEWLAVAELLVDAGSHVGAGMLDDADDELAEWLRGRLPTTA